MDDADCCRAFGWAGFGVSSNNTVEQLHFTGEVLQDHKWPIDGGTLEELRKLGAVEMDEKEHLHLKVAIKVADGRTRQSPVQ